MCLVYDRSKVSFKQFPIKTGQSEIVAAVGKIQNIQRKIVVITAYISPKTKAKQTHETLGHISDAILKAKTELRDPMVIVGGDFNRRDPTEAVEAFPDIKVLDTGPTRGNAKLDLIATNLGDEIGEMSVCDPLILSLIHI